MNIKAKWTTTCRDTNELHFVPVVILQQEFIVMFKEMLPGVVKAVPSTCAVIRLPGGTLNTVPISDLVEVQ